MRSPHLTQPFHELHNLHLVLPLAPYHLASRVLAQFQHAPPVLYTQSRFMVQEEMEVMDPTTKHPEGSLNLGSCKDLTQGTPINCVDTQVPVVRNAHIEVIFSKKEKLHRCKENE